MRPPEFTGGNSVLLRSARRYAASARSASMRPPEFTGGNSVQERMRAHVSWIWPGFNEAAGIHRQEHSPAPPLQGFAGVIEHASMRPPEFTGGNRPAWHGPPFVADSKRRFNEAAGIHRRKPARTRGAEPEGEAVPGGFNEAAGIHRRKRKESSEPML